MLGPKRISFYDNFRLLCLDFFLLLLCSIQEFLVIDNCQTGGSALGEISTRSSSSSFANAIAAEIDKTAGSTLSPTTRTCLAVINWLILCGFSF